MHFKDYKAKIISWGIWFLLVVLWNYGYPAASPFLDVLIAVILSLLNLIFLRLIKNKR